jgi:hypothetical protein
MNGKLPRPADAGAADMAHNARESWRIFGIMAEFVDATERLAQIRPAVSIFGSARAPADSPYYLLAENIARLLSDAGFSVVSGGGPGIMEAANKGAYFGKSPSVGLNIHLPNEQLSNRYQDISLTFHHFFARKVNFVKFATAYVVLPGALARWTSCPRRLPWCRPARRAKCPSSWCIRRSGRGSWTGSASVCRRST